MNLIDRDDLWGGWALTRKCAELVIDQLRLRSPNNILECGSGSSSLIFTEYASQHPGVTFVSLDHDDCFASRSRDMLVSSGLTEFGTIITAPLTSDDPPWYDVDFGDASFDFVLVDGPPGSTGGRANALPALWDNLSGEFVLILDDAQRRPEAEILDDWNKKFQININLIDVEKGRSMAVVERG